MKSAMKIKVGQMLAYQPNYAMTCDPNDQVHGYGKKSQYFMV